MDGLIIMSIDRCRHIVAPLKWQVKTKWIHITCWVIFILSALLLWYQIYATNSNTRSRAFFHVYGAYIIESTVIEIIFMIAMTVTNVLIYKALTRSNTLTKRNKKQTMKVLSVLLVMEASVILLITPYDILRIVVHFKYFSTSLYPSCR